MTHLLPSTTAKFYVAYIDENNTTMLLLPTVRMSMLIQYLRVIDYSGSQNLGFKEFSQCSPAFRTLRFHSTF
jgi:hypothetical protein